MMPEMDGFEFIEELKKKPEHRPIPIVFVTSKDLTQADRLPLNGGIAKLIDKKSFAHEDLLSGIGSTLETNHSLFFRFFRYNLFSKIESNLLASICSPINHTY